MTSILTAFMSGYAELKSKNLYINPYSFVIVTFHILRTFPIKIVK